MSNSLGGGFLTIAFVMVGEPKGLRVLIRNFARHCYRHELRGSKIVQNGSWGYVEVLFLIPAQAEWQMDPYPDTTGYGVDSSPVKKSERPSSCLWMLSRHFAWWDLTSVFSCATPFPPVNQALSLVSIEHLLSSFGSPFFPVSRLQRLPASAAEM